MLHGGGPEDVVECTYSLGAEMLRLAGLDKNAAQARRRMRNVVADGSAAAKMRDVVKAQGGDPRVVDEPDRLPKARSTRPVKAPKAGIVRSIDPLELGLASVSLGAGRTRADQDIDPTAGLRLHVKPGDRVKKGETLIEIHSANATLANAVQERIAASIEIGARKRSTRPLIIQTIRR